MRAPCVLVVALLLGAASYANAQNPDLEVGYLRHIQSFTTWSQHRQLIDQDGYGAGLKTLLQVYRTEFHRLRSPVLAAALCRCYIRERGLAMYKIWERYDPDIGAELDEFLKSRSAMSSPPAIFERYQLIRSAPFELTGDEPVIGHAYVTKPDGSPAPGPDGKPLRPPILDGSYDVRRKEALVKKIVAIAKQIAPYNSELAYMIAYEEPHGVKRMNDLDGIVRSHMNVFGFAGCCACAAQAKELRRKPAAQEWNSRAKVILAHMPKELRELNARAFGLQNDRD